MPDDSGVVSALRAQRPKRRAPTPRANRSPAVAPELTSSPLAPAPAPRSDPTPQAADRSLPEQPAATIGQDAPPPPTVSLSASADTPTVNFAVRIRRPFDELLSRRIGELRARGVRSSKVELTEMLLAELEPTAPEDLEQRLAAFRRHAPR